MSERIVIGESAQAGLPISAPLEKKRLGDLPSNSIRLRWRKKDDSFVLEYWFIGERNDDQKGVWVEVPCVLDS